MEKCIEYNKKQFKESIESLREKLSSNTSLFSTYFHNIDGNATNFDLLCTELKALQHEFSVIGIAETNITKCNKDLYKISDNYTSINSSKIEGKSKGSGIGMFIHKKWLKL